MLKSRESVVMKELRKTREKMYQDIKDMSREEMIRYFCTGADKFRKELKKFRAQKVNYAKS